MALVLSVPTHQHHQPSKNFSKTHRWGKGEYSLLELGQCPRPPPPPPRPMGGGEGGGRVPSSRTSEADWNSRISFPQLYYADGLCECTCIYEHYTIFQLIYSSGAILTLGGEHLTYLMSVEYRTACANDRTIP